MFYNSMPLSLRLALPAAKGYYVLSTQTNQKQNIFLLFSTFTPYKETLFNALKNLPKSCSLDIYFHHHNIKIFETLIREQAAYYNKFIILPEIHPNTLNILSKLDAKNTYLLDIGFKEYRESYPGIFQNFEKDIYSILVSSRDLIAKYKRLFLIYPDTLRTTDIISGFNKFAKKKIIDTGVKSDIGNDIQKQDAFIVIDDNHLVDIIKIAKEKKWKPGKDLGVLSYNETNLKSIIADGITTITTDFYAMGKTMAKMVSIGTQGIIENPFIMIDRGSF